MVTLHPPFPAPDGDSAWLAVVTSYAAETSPARSSLSIIIVVMGSVFVFFPVVDGYQAEEREQGELIMQWLVPNFVLDEPKG
ncbi:hypothetical protein Taro_054800 [Colocasia esculenta]|uniref:Uncharacterized protein n=1 Tax=Colocasia esculenta TaxID=4460 RepID=A0A843XPN0_COLES|nr:hypothetical protein [Colocasia esculenta]